MWLFFLLLLATTSEAASLRLVDAPCGAALRADPPKISSGDAWSALAGDADVTTLLTHTFAGGALLEASGTNDPASCLAGLGRDDAGLRGHLVRRRLELAVMELRRGRLSDADAVERRRARMRASILPVVRGWRGNTLAPLRAWWAQRGIRPAAHYHPEQVAEYYLSPHAIARDVFELENTPLKIHYPAQPMRLYPPPLSAGELEPGYWFHNLAERRQDPEGILRVGSRSGSFPVAYEERPYRVRLIANFRTPREGAARRERLENAIRRTQFAAAAPNWRPAVQVEDAQIWIMGLPKDPRTQKFLFYLFDGDVN